MDISKITDPEAKRFLKAFFADRETNREFYKLVSENEFDFRMINTPGRKSDSPRESLAHQINVQRTYMRAVKTGELKFGAFYDSSLKGKSKDELLDELGKADLELVDLLSDARSLKEKIITPWNKEGIGAIAMLWAMDSHEILHTGWNLAVMDHLDVPRFSALQKMWGK